MKSTSLSWHLFSWCFSAFSIIIHARQTNRLNEFLKSRHSYTTPDLVIETEYTPVYISPQDELMEYDKITALPGQPAAVDFDQYSGYITVDPKAGRALFYYFVESPENSTTSPLVLWLNGGPGCSSLIGAMQEQGPFRVNPDGKTLYANPYAWNNVANVIFLESPAGVGFSYSNKSSDYDNCGDKNTARDSYTFLVNWLERFPHYKTRDFYLTGESYAGHYIPQLAHTILLGNKNTNQTVINLKGVAIGNAWINDYTDTLGIYDHLWTHGYNSDEMNKEIHTCCDVNVTNDACKSAQKKGDSEHGDINIDNIYDPWCDDSKNKNGSTGSVQIFDPCTDNYSYDYLNLPIVQQTLHAKPTSWFDCSPIITWNDAPATTLPLIKKIMASGIRLWLYSGDMDGNVPVTSSRYSINTFKLPTRTRWYPWYLNKEVGGYLVEYEGLVFTTVRGAGHEVPSYQPERSLAVINSFLQGKLLPARAG